MNLQEKIPFYKRLGFKLASTIMAIMLLIIAFTGFFNFRAAEKQFSHLLQQEFHSSQLVIQNFLGFVSQKALASARQTANDPALLELLEHPHDGNTLANHLHKLQMIYKADVMIILDGNGEILATTAENPPAGSNLKSFDLVKQCLNSQGPGTSVVQDQGNFILFGSAELPNTSLPHFILTGYALNNSLIDNVQTSTHLHIALVRERSIIATSILNNGKRITVIPVPFLEYQKILASSGKVFRTHLLGKNVFVSAFRIPGMQANMAGSIFITHQTDIIEETNRSFLKKTGLIFMLGISLTILLVIYSSNLILSPIRSLTQATDQLAKGQSSTPITLSTDDEIGVLAKNFNVMVQTIQERDRELLEHNQSLKKRVEERTEEISRQSLLISHILNAGHELGIGAMDLNLNITYFNYTAAKILGLDFENIIGRNLHNIHGRKVLIPRIKFLLQAVDEKGSSSFEYEHLTSEGIIPLEVQVSAMKSDTGDPTGYVFLLRDMTERYALEEKVRSGQKFEAFSTLAAGLAHDLNNSLQAIMGNISLALLETPNSDSAQNEYLQNAESSTILAKDIGHKMLIMSPSGLNLSRPVDMKNILDDAIAAIEEESCTIEGDIAPDLWPIGGVKEYLRNSIDHILDNSLDALDGEGTISITAKNIPSDQEKSQPLSGSDRIAISIHDTGRGISLDHINKIFDPYFSTKEMGSDKGTGLSLATTLATVRKHRGDITVSSTLYEGTTLTIFLPILSKLDN